MDAIDSKILELLQKDGRMSMVNLGKKVNMTQPAVKERVRKLEEKGIITHYRSVLSPQKLGKGITAFILFEADQCHDFADFCKQYSDVVDLYRISGQYNHLLKVVTESMETLEGFTNAARQYGRSSVLIVLSTRFEQKAMLPQVQEEV